MKHCLSRVVMFLFFLGHSATFAADSSTVYVNDTIGVKVELSALWRIYTTHDGAPKTLQAHLPKDKGVNDSPLFLATTQDQKLYARLLIEDTDLDLRDYFALLAESVAASSVDILSARWVPDRNSIQWEYRFHQPNKPRIRFRERVTVRKNGQALRLSFWSLEPLLQKYHQTINELYHHVEIRDLEHPSLAWKTPWAGLEILLPPENIPGIQPVQTDQARRLVCSDPTSTLLWKIQGQNNTVHLFGSIHVGKPDFYPLAPDVETAFHRSDHLVVEVNTQSPAFMEATKKMVTRATLPEGNTLRDLLSEPVYRNLLNKLGEFGLPPDGFLIYKPWFLALVLTQLQTTHLGFIEEYGVERYFFEQKPEAMDILELESLEQQLRVFEGLDDEMYLAYTLLGLKAAQAKTQLLIDAWQCSDKKKLRNLIFNQPELNIPDFSPINQKLFLDRNIALAKQIDAFLTGGEGDYFVVVGAGHLIGKQSIVDLLQQSGHEVKPVTLNLAR